MTTATLLGIGTSCPPNTMSQADALKMFTDIVCEDERQKRLAQALYRKSGVKNRHTIIPHRAAYTWGAPVAEAIEVGANQSSTINLKHCPTLSQAKARGQPLVNECKYSASLLADWPKNQPSQPFQTPGFDRKRLHT